MEDRYDYIISKLLNPNPRPSELLDWRKLDQNIDFSIVENVFTIGDDEVNPITGLKAKRTYYSSGTDGIEEVAKIVYTDLLNKNNEFIGMKKTFIWARKNVNTLEITWDEENIKEKIFNYHGVSLEEERKFRRERVLTYVLDQAKGNPQMLILINAIFTQFEQSINNWTLTGNATDFHIALDEAPKPMSDYLQYPTSNKMLPKVIDYLKFYFK